MNVSSEQKKIAKNVTEQLIKDIIFTEDFVNYTANKVNYDDVEIKSIIIDGAGEVNELPVLMISNISILTMTYFENKIDIQGQFTSHTFVGDFKTKFILNLVQNDTKWEGKLEANFIERIGEPTELEVMVAKSISQNYIK